MAGKHAANTGDAPPVIAASAAAAAREAPPDPAREPATVEELAQHLRVLAARLVRDELALARVGLVQRMKASVSGLAMLSASGLLAFFGLGCLVAAAVTALNIAVQDWWACFIVAGALGLTSVVIVLPGWQGVQHAHPVRTDTRESVKKDVAAVQDAITR